MSESILERQNNFLYLDDKDGVVKITPQAAAMKDVKILFRRDKSMGKRFFQKNIDFLYYTQHKDSPLSHKMEESKIRDVKRQFEWLKDFDDLNIYYVALKDLFKSTHYSMKELRYLKAMEDIEAIINMAMDVPIQIEEKVELKRDIDTFDERGNPTTRTIYYKEKIKIDNSTAKTKAISNIKALNTLVEMLDTQIKAEYRKEQSNITRALFDK